MGVDRNAIDSQTKEPLDLTSKLNLENIMQNWDKFIILICFIILVATFAVLNENFLTFRNMSNILYQIALLAIVAMGMTFVIIGGGFDLSAGSVVALSGTSAAIVMIEYGTAAGILVGLLIGAAIGVFNGTMVAKVNISPFIATLGTLVIARGLALGITGGTSVYNLPPSFFVLSGQFLGIPVPALLLLGVFIIGFVILKYTSFGLKIFAVGGNREAARLSGIKVDRVIQMTYVISGTCAGLAGLILASRIRSGEPTVGVFLELYAIAAVVLGGTSLKGGQGSLAKTMLGVLFIGVLQNGLNLMNVPYYWQQVAIGLVFVIAAAIGMVRASNT